MTLPDRDHPSLYLGVSLVSTAVLLLQITLTRIFSFSLWYHFAYVTISVALLGYGASGAFLAVFPGLEGRLPARRLSLYAVGSGLAMVLGLVVFANVPFHPFQIRKDPTHQVPYMLVYYAAAAVPFFLAGLCIALALKTRAERVSRLYFFDLVGAGVGCLIVVFLIPPLTAPGAVVAAGTLVALAGVLFASGEGRGALVVPAVGVVAWRCSESYLYTTEAMGELLDHLTPNGALSIVVGDTAVPSLGFPRHTMRQHSSWRHCTSAASTTPRAASRWWRQPRACPRWT